VLSLPPRKVIRRSRVSSKSNSCRQLSLLRHNHRPPRTCCASRRHAAKQLLIKVLTSRCAPIVKTPQMELLTFLSATRRVSASKSRFHAKRQRKLKAAARSSGSPRVSTSQPRSSAMRRNSAARLEVSVRLCATAAHQAVMACEISSRRRSCVHNIILTSCK